MIQYKFSGRYSEILERVLDEVGAVEILRETYEDDWQGFIDVDALLSDGRVFSYCYSYGSCSGCDDWEYRGLTDDEIAAEMRRDATYFSDRAGYTAWREQVDKEALK